MRQKITIPRDDLLFVLKNNTLLQTAKIFGCSDGPIKRCIKLYGLDKFTVAHGDKLAISEYQNEIIKGNLLGDGSVHPKGYFRFKQKNHSYAQHVFEKLQPWVSGPYLTGGLTGFHSYVSPYFKELYHEWYPYGKKIVPEIFLTPTSIAYWYMDDGTNIQTNKQASFYTNGFTKSDVERLIVMLSHFGFKSHLNWMHGKYEKQPIIRISRRSYFDFIDFIRPYLFESMLYKADTSKSPIQKTGYGSYKLNKKIADEIRVRYATGTFSQEELAQEFGVKKLAIWCIVNNRTYK